MEKQDWVQFQKDHPTDSEENVLEWELIRLIKSKYCFCMYQIQGKWLSTKHCCNGLLFYTCIHTHTHTHTYLLTELIVTTNKLVWPTVCNEAGDRERMFYNIPFSGLLSPEVLIRYPCLLSIFLISQYFDGLMPENIWTYSIFEISILIQLMSHWANSVFPRWKPLSSSGSLI